MESLAALVEEDLEKCLLQVNVRISSSDESEQSVQHAQETSTTTICHYHHHNLHDLSQQHH